jgi:hypothetical protein
VFDPGTTTGVTAPAGESSYLRELDAVCVDLASSFDELSTSVDTGEFGATTPAQFEAIATSLDATLTAIDEFQAGLSAIDAPAEARGPIADFGSGIEELAAGITRLRDAAVAEDADALEAEFDDLDAVDTSDLDAASEALEDLGARECGPDA